MTTNEKIEAIKRRVEVDRGNVVDENRIPLHILDREELLKEIERLQVIEARMEELKELGRRTFEKVQRRKSK